ncbi:type II toxin-antitoxin system antitoxin SocA domain-containing protein, partial [Campylobacter coli]
MSHEVVLKEENKLEINFNPYELALVKGDLSKLSDVERASYVKNLCESLNLNMLTKPFEYIVLNGKLTLYANKSATDQLRQIRKVSITKTEVAQVGDIYMVTAYAATPDGRTDCDTGALNIKNLGGDNLANAIMKAITKAKRRVTLSICGLGMLDESELETIKEKRFLNPNEDLKVWGSDEKAIENKAKLNKILWFADRAFMYKNYASLTQTSYIKNPQGPVVKKLENILTSLEKNE